MSLCPEFLVDADESRPRLSGVLLTTQLLSHPLQPRLKEGIETLSFLISPWKPPSYTVKNASLIKVTRAGNFPLAGSLLPGGPCATTNQGIKRTLWGLGSADGPARHSLFSFCSAAVCYLNQGPEMQLPRAS